MVKEEINEKKLDSSLFLSVSLSVCLSVPLSLCLSSVSFFLSYLVRGGETRGGGGEIKGREKNSQSSKDW